MELWIRSQDKEKLLKINGIQYQNCKLIENETIEANILIGFHNSYDNEILGEYSTEERAFEVLDEIQGILNVKENLQFNGVDINDAFKDMDKEKVRLMLYKMSVYEMPLD